jgi:hypothetical protein
VYKDFKSPQPLSNGRLLSSLSLFLTQKEGIKTEKESKKRDDDLVPPLSAPISLPQPVERNKDVI